MDRLPVLLQEELQRQHGVFTRAQAERAGLTRRQIDHRRNGGLLVDCAPGVWRLVSSPASPLSKLWVALLALPNAMVSHRSAAWIEGWWDTVPRTEVTVAYRWHRIVPETIVHRQRPSSSGWAVVRDGLRITRPEVTVLQVARYMTPASYCRLVDDFVAGRPQRVEDLADWFRLVCGRGRPGSALARRELAGRVAGEIAESRLERAFLELVERHGLPRPELQWSPPWNPGSRVDGAYIDHHVVIELDSHRFHGNSNAFEQDRRRDQLAAAHGWNTLRFTWAQLRHEPEFVAETIRRTLATRRPPPSTGQL